jgi:hypothetical protein
VPEGFDDSNRHQPKDKQQLLDQLFEEQRVIRDKIQKLTEEERSSRTPPPPKKDNWLSMRDGAQISKYDAGNKEDRYARLIEKDKKIIEEFQKKTDRALYDSTEFTTFMRRESKIGFTPKREEDVDRYSKYSAPRPNADKENVQDPYLSFVGKSMKKYDFSGILAHEDDSKRPEDRSPAPVVDYKRTSYTPDALRSYNIEPKSYSGWNDQDKEKEMDRERERAPLKDYNNEDIYKRYPCKNYILTGPQNPQQATLQYTPYKNMNYPEMINKIREDRA